MGKKIHNIEFLGDIEALKVKFKLDFDEGLKILKN